MAQLTSKRKEEIQKFALGVGCVLIGFTVLASLYRTYLLGWNGFVLRRPAVGGVGLVLIALGQLVPSILDTPERLWMKMAHFLGYWNTRILLTLVYFLIVMPMGFLARLFGWDELRLKRPAGDTFYSKAPDSLKDLTHFEHPF